MRALLDDGKKIDNFGNELFAIIHQWILTDYAKDDALSLLCQCVEFSYDKIPSSFSFIVESVLKYLFLY